MLCKLLFNGTNGVWNLYQIIPHGLGVCWQSAFKCFFHLSFLLPDQLISNRSTSHGLTLSFLPKHTILRKQFSSIRNSLISPKWSVRWRAVSERQKPNIEIPQLHLYSAFYYFPKEFVIIKYQQIWKLRYNIKRSNNRLELDNFSVQWQSSIFQA